MTVTYVVIQGGTRYEKELPPDMWRWPVGKLEKWAVFHGLIQWCDRIVKDGVVQSKPVWALRRDGDGRA